MGSGKVYLIPTILHEEALETIPSYILDSVKDCQVFFVETEKTARRFLKKNMERNGDRRLPVVHHS